MSARLDVDMKFPDGVEQKVLELLEKDPRFQPQRVGSRSDWSVHIEFGTEGFKGGRTKDSYRKRGQVSPVEEDLREWVEKKLGKTGKERDRIARKVYRNIMDQGIAPNPFLRPAVHSVIHRYSSSGDAWEGKEQSLVTIANEIVEEMRRYLIEKNIPYTGETMRELYRMPLDGSEVHSSYLEKIPQNVWESDEADARGNVQRYNDMKRRRGQR